MNDFKFTPNNKSIGNVLIVDKKGLFKIFIPLDFYK
jgi:hypothetical protein